MITLASIFFIWGIISIIRLHKICKDEGIPFNPLEGTLTDWMGFLIGTIVGGITTVVLIIEYLP